MVNINDALDLDVVSAQNNVIHNLDGRVKLISVLFIIIYSVFSNQLFVPIILEIFLLIVMGLAKLSFKASFTRILLLIPFGGAIILFQPFIHPGNIIWVSSISWIHITDAGLNWGIILMSRLIVCLTAIVILSSTSPMQEVVESFRKLGMPRDLAMILSIMVRFLFMFIDELAQIRKSQKSRNFDIHSKLTPYKWRIKQVGYTVAMMFLKSYEKGETTYSSMVSRGFSNDSQFYVSRKKMTKSNYVFIISIVLLILFIEILVIFYAPQLGYFGLHFTAT
ncbi:MULTISPECIES: cobalt ECF transporter T component CbiQ [unclassified Methanobrevibacter]|jgi:cobalt/nickel transport system permease protein|uniref:cobalt ECF transporter T component CbiQ n=1 Tax=unclassified Methanobrevibacter TaxID=2638681 RepID=UPI0039B8EC88